MSFEAFLIVALGGLLVGVLSGMFGIGGGTMIVPLLNLVFSVPIAGATATSLFTIAPTAISGTFKHVQQKTADIKLGVLIGISGALTSALGAWLSGDLPETVLVGITALVILYSAYRMFKSSRKKQLAAAESSPKSVKRTVIIAVILGLFAGFIAGLVGVGGGFIIVPMSIALLGFTMHRAAGTSLLAIAIIAIPGIISHCDLGPSGISRAGPVGGHYPGSAMGCTSGRSHTRSSAAIGLWRGIGICRRYAYRESAHTVNRSW